jgi:chaperone modulatory protein CbpM
MSMEERTIFKIREIISLYNVDEEFICDCIEREWIILVDSKKRLMDREDVARILLIRDLKEDFGVNDEAIPLILHLIDQLHLSRSLLNQYLDKDK